MVAEEGKVLKNDDRMNDIHYAKQKKIEITDTRLLHIGEFLLN